MAADAGAGMESGRPSSLATAWTVALWLLSCLALWPSWAEAQQTERRVALVIGNDRYPRLPVDQQLRNAVSDATTMGSTLRTLGFDVIEGRNLDRVGMLRKLSELRGNLHAGDVAFVFYAGHGVALSGQNYVLPVDVAPVDASALADPDAIADQAISERSIDERIRSSGARLVVVVLDACRDDPLSPRLGRSAVTSRGLAPPPQTRGIMTIHSASEGQQALDRLGTDDADPNSVFTRVFSRELLKPGVGLREAAFATQDRVAALAREAHQDQFPEIDSRFTGADPRFGPSGPKVATAVAPDPPSAAMASPPPLDRPVTDPRGRPQTAGPVIEAAVPPPAAIPPGNDDYLHVEASAAEVAGVLPTGMCNQRSCIYRLKRYGEDRYKGDRFSVEFIHEEGGWVLLVQDAQGDASKFNLCMSCRGREHVYGPLERIAVSQKGGPYVVLKIFD